MRQPSTHHQPKLLPFLALGKMEKMKPQQAAKTPKKDGTCQQSASSLPLVKHGLIPVVKKYWVANGSGNKSNHDW